MLYLAPTITGVSPVSVPVGTQTATTITVTGSNFYGTGTTATWHGITFTAASSTTGIKVVSSTELTLTVPASSLNKGFSGPIVITNPGPLSSALSAKDIFTVAPARTLTSLSISVDGVNVQFSATVLGTSGVIPTGTVSFEVDGKVVKTGTLNSFGQVGPITYTSAAGKHTFLAVYAGDANNALSQSTAQVITIG